MLSSSAFDLVSNRLDTESSLGYDVSRLLFSTTEKTVIQHDLYLGGMLMVSTEDNQNGSPARNLLTA